MSLRHELRLFWVAVEFLTRVPVPRWIGFDPTWLQASARHFPAVGACIGIFSAAVLWTASQLFPPWVAAGLSMAAGIVLTGAFHEDGLADTCDALGGAADRERALVIMKDSRIGTYGTVGLLLVLGLKAATLAAMPLALSLPALVLGHVASRAAAVALMHWLPYAGDTAFTRAAPSVYRATKTALYAAWGWVACVSALLLAGSSADLPTVGAALVAAIICAGVCARRWKRRLGGITGDTLGATQQLTELCVLLTFLNSLHFMPWTAGVL